MLQLRLYTNICEFIGFLFYKFFPRVWTGMAYIDHTSFQETVSLNYISVLIEKLSTKVPRRILEGHYRTHSWKYEMLVYSLKNENMSNAQW